MGDGEAGEAGENEVTFQDWHGKNIKRMAEQFAQCDDAPAIGEVLWQLHAMWVTEMEHQLAMAEKAGRVGRMVSALTKTLESHG